MPEIEQTELFATMSIIFEDGSEVRVAFYGNDSRIYTDFTNDGQPPLRRLAGVAGAFSRGVFQIIRNQLERPAADILEQVVFQEMIPPGGKIGSESLKDSDPF